MFDLNFTKELERENSVSGIHSKTVYLLITETVNKIKCLKLQNSNASPN
jgi:hypothetical protein